MKLGLGTRVWGKVKTQIVDAATGRIQKETGWRQNLVYDATLNAMAGAANDFSNIFSAIKVGSGNTPNSLASGGVTFTQATNQITASVVGWFTTNLPTSQSYTNAILKYGTGSGGAEFYITSIDGTGTIATVTTSATVSTPTIATIWFVNRTTLQTFSLASNTYDTTSGNNTTSFSGATAVMTRKITFPVQSSSYTVNEIGYASSAAANSTVNGRIVLGSSDVVSPTQFYVVFITMTYTVSPGTITAVTNLGTNFDTSGNAAWQCWNCTNVLSSGAAGTSAGANGGAGMSSQSMRFSVLFHTVNDITQNSTISTGAAVPVTTGANYQTGNINNPTNSGQPVGVGVSNNFAFSITTAGETCYSLCLGQNINNTGE